MSKGKVCCSYVTLTLFYLLFVGFWLGLIFGYAFFSFLDDERDQKCYAMQDSSI